MFCSLYMTTTDSTCKCCVGCDLAEHVYRVLHCTTNILQKCVRNTQHILGILYKPTFQINLNFTNLDVFTRFGHSGLIRSDNVIKHPFVISRFLYVVDFSRLLGNLYHISIILPLVLIPSCVDYLLITSMHPAVKSRHQGRSERLFS